MSVAVDIRRRRPDRCRERHLDAYQSRRVGYLNNRHYDPTTGTFLTVDPLVQATGQPYIYGNANPVTYSDPNGLCPTNSAAAAACYSRLAASQNRGSSHDRFTAKLAAIWYGNEHKARTYVESFAERPDTVGYQSYYVVNHGKTEESIRNLANQGFARDAGREIAGFVDTGNGFVLRPEEAAGWEGAPDRNGTRSMLGPTGWNPSLVDDNSPEGHLIGYLVLAYEYGGGQTRAGLNNVEWDPTNRGHSQQDYDLGLIGIDLGVQLRNASGGDVIRSLIAATRGNWSSATPPNRILPTNAGSPGLISSVPCYLSGRFC